MNEGQEQAGTGVGLTEPAESAGAGFAGSGAGTVIELLLREPEIVAWLEPKGRDEWVDDDDDDEPPRAA